MLISIARQSHTLKRYIAQPTSIVSDATRIPLEDASADVVTSFETIEHFQDHEKFLSEIARILRPGGVLIISSPNRTVYTEQNQHKNPFHVRELDREQFRTALTAHFPNMVVFDQRPVCGSALIAEHGLTALAGFESRDGVAYTQVQGVPSVHYFVAVASTAPLPPIDSSLLCNDRYILQLQESIDSEAERANAGAEALLELQDKLTESQANLAEVERRAMPLAALLDERTAQLTDAGLTIATFERSTTEAERRAGGLAATLDERTMQLTEAEIRIAALEKSVAEADRRAKDLGTTLDERTAQLNEALCMIAALETTVADRDRQLGLDARRIATMKSSLSWRIMSPFREMYRPIRRLGASTSGAEARAASQQIQIRSEIGTEQKSLRSLRRLLREAPRPQSPQVVKMRGNIEKIIGRNQIVFVLGWLEHRLKDAVPTIEFGSAKFDMLANSFPTRRGDVNSILSGDSVSDRGLLCLIDATQERPKSNATIKADRNFQQTVGVDEVASWSKLLYSVFEQLYAASEQLGSTGLYNLPEPWLPILTQVNREMTLEESERKRVVRSERGKSKKPTVSVIFVQCGPVPFLSFCFPALSTCGYALELVVANNSAHLRNDTLRLLLEARELYGLPFTYIDFENNIGFGNACNIAADHAEGELLLFHNNDVLPTSPDDYNRVFSIACERPFIVGARQFFPRGDIMHDGIRLGLLDANLADGRADLISGFSLGRGIPPARLFGPMLTSGSLMCLQSRLFKSVGGFSSEYLFGHFEDLDLCLRLHQMGAETRIADTRFIHSEGGGSDVPEFLSKTVPYVNRRIFTSKWRATTEAQGA